MMETGLDALGTKRGRPALWGEDEVNSIAKELVKKRKEQRTIDTEEFGLLADKQAAVAMQRRGVGCGPIVVTSRSSKSRLKKKMKLGSPVKAQLKTKARIDAVKDPRNAYSMFCMCRAFCEQLRPEMFFNWDATQYVIGGDKQDKCYIRVKTEEDGDAPVTAQSNGELEFGIKLYHCHNAGGQVAPPVYVIADGELAEEECHADKVIGLGNPNVMGSYGYVVRTKTRCCNDAFYRWFLKEVVCQFVAAARDTYEYKVSRNCNVYDCII